MLVRNTDASGALICPWPRTAAKTQFVATAVVVPQVLANGGTPAAGVLAISGAAGAQRPLLVAGCEEFPVAKNR